MLFASAPGQLVTTGPLRLASPAAVNAGPRLVSSPLGDLYAVWEGRDGAATRVYFAAGTLLGWSPPRVISRAGAPASLQPDLALDPSGAVLVVWAEDSGTTSGIVMRRLARGEWNEPHVVRKRPRVHCEYPSVAAGLDAGEGVAVVWQERFGSLSRVMGAALLPGLDWRVGPLPAPDQSADLNIYPRLLTTPREGTAYWFSIEEDLVRLNAAELDLTRGQWYDAPPLVPSCVPLERLPLLFDPRTRSLGALWVEESALSNNGIRLEWQDPCAGLTLPCAPGDILQDSFPAVAQSAPDELTFAWRATDSTGSRIHLARINTATLDWESASFAPAAPDRVPGSSRPVLAADAFGLIHVLWISDPAAGGDGGIYYSYGLWAGDFFRF